MIDLTKIGNTLSLNTLQGQNWTPKPPVVPTTITGSNSGSASTIALPTPTPDNNNYQGMVANAEATLKELQKSIKTMDAPPAEDTSFYDKVMAELKPPTAPTSGATDYATAYKDIVSPMQADINAKTQVTNSAKARLGAINAQLSGIVAESQTQQLQLEQNAVKTGAVSSGFLNREQQEINRQSAIKALPLQAQALGVQAEVAAAQGDQQLSQDLMTQATTHLDKLFTIQQQDIQNQYEAKVKSYDSLIGRLDKAEERRIEELKLEAKNKLDAENATIAYQRDIAKVKLEDSLKKSEITASDNELLSIADAKALGVPYGTTVGQAKAKNIIPGTALTDKTLQLTTVKSNIDIINGIVNNPAITTSVGPNRTAREGYLVGIPGLFGFGKSPQALANSFGNTQNFIGDVENMRSNLNLSSLINAKAQGATFGALSDNELQMLASAATKIGTWAIKDKNGVVTGYNASEAKFKEELNKISNFARLDFILKGGTPAEVGATLLPNGKYAIKNSDGTYTLLN
jgi:hypothetical protein